MIWTCADMRFESVTAHAFGPLAGAKLEFAPGLTVVAGANESGKSSWHAAMFAALCGRRRGRGASTLEDREFSRLRKPWEGTGWSVTAVVTLDDGRRIELAQDLAAKVDSRAMDLDLARDVSNEVMHDGSPDGSRWLGLDRDSFTATACINQTAMLRVLEEASGLQEVLSRAAASASADETAAGALASIETFKANRVGVDRANAVKPLRQAKDRLRAERDRLSAALTEHAEYLGLVDEADGARRAADEQRSAVALLDAQDRQTEALVAAARDAEAARRDADSAREKASAAGSDLESLRRRTTRAAEIDALLDGKAPEGASAADQTSRAVDQALAAWRSAPVPRALAGDSVEELRAELGGLPDAPDGDLRPDPSVVSAEGDLARARENVTTNERRRPAEPADGLGPEFDAAMAATPSVVRDLATDLAAAEAMPSPTADEVERLNEAAVEARQRADLARSQAESIGAAAGSAHQPSAARSPVRVAALAAAGLLLVAAVALFAAGVPVGGTAAAVVAVGAAVVGLVAPRPRAGIGAGDVSTSGQSAAQAWAAATTADRQALAAEEALRSAQSAARSATTITDEVRARCAARGLPTDSRRLRELAEAVDSLRVQRSAFATWSAEQEAFVAALASSERRVRDALVGRGVVNALDPAITVEHLAGEYRAACESREQQSAQSSRRAVIEQRIVEREAAEAVFISASSRRGEAVAEVVAAARRIGVLEAAAPDRVEDSELDRLVGLLDEAARDRIAQAAQDERATGLWAELTTVLDGATLDALLAGLGKQQALVEELDATAVGLHTLAGDAASRLAAAAAALGREPGQIRDVATAEAELRSVRALVEAERASLMTANAAAERADGVRRERGERVASVAEAEEAVAAAQAELDRVNDLAATLDLTSEFLRKAQERVHRNIAPMLSGTLATWLPQVTAGRYSEAMIDPATLKVRVRASDHPWRDADALSVGTAEQIYLLLRMALAEHVTAGHDTCPLLLDDVTVQADEARTVQILELLLTVSQSRQVVLFAQEEMVARWARERLTGERDCLVELQPVTSR